MIDIVAREFISLAKASQLLRNTIGQEIVALGANPEVHETFSSDDELSPAQLHYAVMATYGLEIFRYYSRDVYLCHPDKPSLKTSSAIFEPKAQVQLLSIGFDGARALGLESEKAARERIKIYLDGPFANISVNTGRINAPKTPDFSILNLPYVGPDQLPEIERLLGEMNPEFRAFCEDFSGWYVGFDENSFIEMLNDYAAWHFRFDVERLWSECDEDKRNLLARRFPLIEQRVLSFNEVPEDIKRRAGRPRTPNLVERFTEKWPLGLEEVSLSHAARELGCDRKTLRNALEEVGIKRE